MLDKQKKPVKGRSDPLTRGCATFTAVTILAAAGFALVGGVVAADVKEEALPKVNRASEATIIAQLRDKAGKSKQPVAKISEAEATKIALERMPGKVTEVKIERKLGKNVWVVEIQTDQGERDVFVDIETGKILGTD